MSDDLRSLSGNYTALREAIRDSVKQETAPMSEKLDRMHRVLVGDEDNPFGLVHHVEECKQRWGLITAIAKWTGATVVGTILVGIVSLVIGAFSGHGGGG